MADRDMLSRRSSGNVRGRLERSGRTLAARIEDARLDDDLRARWTSTPATAEPYWTARLDRFRRTVVPWMNDTRPLNGARILEIGSGDGPSTVALAEQGAVVTCIDIDRVAVDRAAAHLDEVGLVATHVVGNSADLHAVAGQGEFDEIVFWAVLEHMTIDERLTSLEAAWSHLDPGGLLVIVETPNRLWPYDAHTSQLPFFSWLPYELAYRYSGHSPRNGFGDRYLVEAMPDDMEHFLRRGHGVSFHEIDLAIGDHRQIEIASSMQLFWRRRNPARRIGWAMSRAGRIERTLRAMSPDTHPAWFQPYIYLALRKR